MPNYTDETFISKEAKLIVGWVDQHKTWIFYKQDLKKSGQNILKAGRRKGTN